MEIILTSQGFQTIQIPKETSHLNIRIDKRINASLMLTYSELDTQLPVSLEVEEGSSLTILLKKQEGSKSDIAMKANLMQDAFLNFAYLDMEKQDSTLDLQVELLKQGAHAQIQSACIALAKKDMHMCITHHVPHTIGTMKNYAIVQEEQAYRMEACGKIVKGAYESASHQTTRVLTMSEKHNSEVIPLLLIDENDVKASHATTLGQPDENQLYYLQTRGLTREQALGLLSVGYMMPISEVLDDRKVVEQLKNEIEMKVGLHA